MRLIQSVTLSQGSSWIMVCCALMLVACGNEQTDTLNNPSLAIDETRVSLQGSTAASISPFPDQSCDSLIPPEPPALSITAQPGALNFHWLPIEAQRRARLYRYDPQLGSEMLVREFDDPTKGSWQLPSHTHATAWHRLQYRIELCSVDDCVSSARASLAGLAANTLDSLSPAVFIEGERYAEQIALNDDATLAVVSLPVEGALEIQARIGRQWTLIQRLRLNALSLSTTRTLHVALSGDGDTLAVFIQDDDAAADQGIRILERLGEAWLETTAWSVTAAMPEPGRQSSDAHNFYGLPHTAITLSANGEQILLHARQRLISYRRSAAGWSVLPQTLVATDPSTATEFQTSGSSARLVASAQDAAFTRVFTLVEQDQLLYFSLWTPSDNAGSWQRRAHVQLQGLNPGAQLAISSNTVGSSVIVAGWENAGSQAVAPVLWRYSVDTMSDESFTASAFSLSMMDSLRAPPTEHANPTLVFSADASLSIVALGWQLSDDFSSMTTTLPDASLSTYVFEPSSRQWQSALELPESLPTLAGQSIADEIILSADGKTLMMTRRESAAQSTRNHVGEILVMR